MSLENRFSNSGFGRGLGKNIGCGRQTLPCLGGFGVGFGTSKQPNIGKHFVGTGVVVVGTVVVVAVVVVVDVLGTDLGVVSGSKI